MHRGDASFYIRCVILTALNHTLKHLWASGSNVTKSWATARKITSNYCKINLPDTATSWTSRLGARLERRMEHRLAWGFLSFSSVPPGKCQDRTSIKPQTSPSKSLQIHHSYHPTNRTMNVLLQKPQKRTCLELFVQFAEFFCCTLM
jgi:hypothetical protein